MIELVTRLDRTKTTNLLIQKHFKCLFPERTLQRNHYLLLNSLYKNNNNNNNKCALLLIKSKMPFDLLFDFFRCNLTIHIDLVLFTKNLKIDCIIGGTYIVSSAGLYI